MVEKGVLVNSIFNFPQHMVFFTTPELLEIGRLPLVTPYDKPTRLEALRYYQRVVDTYDLHATVLHLMGLDHLKTTFIHNGRSERPTVVYGKVIKEILA